RESIVIDNRGGAGGVVGTGFAAKAEPDGYTLLLVPTSHVINPSIHAHLSYDTVKDFAPISTVASATILMAVNPRVPAHSVRELVEAAKAQPQSMASYGSAGGPDAVPLSGPPCTSASGLPLQHPPNLG